MRQDTPRPMRRRSWAAALGLLASAVAVAVPAAAAGGSSAACGHATQTRIATTTTCTYTTPGTDKFTVPAGVSRASFALYGAEGGGGPNRATGGLGAFLAASLPVSAGRVYNVAVGQMGSAGASANGGAGEPNGAEGGPTGSCHGGGLTQPCGSRGFGGGGASQIDTGQLIPGTPGFVRRDLVAGGGGGAGGDARRAPTSSTTACVARGAAGGTGGSATTGNGHDSSPIFSGAYPGGVLAGATGGKGAVRFNPGAGGPGGQGYVDSNVPTQFDGAGHAGYPGSGPKGRSIDFAYIPPGFGGLGGQGTPAAGNCGGGGGGGGGGGYSGGGGGGGGGGVGTEPNKASGGAGGGGGSSYASNDTSSPRFKPGVRRGNGQVTITFKTPGP